MRPRYTAHGVHVKRNGTRIAMCRGCLPLSDVSIDDATMHAFTIVRALNMVDRMLFLYPTKVYPVGATEPPNHIYMDFADAILLGVAQQQYAEFMQTHDAPNVVIPSFKDESNTLLLILPSEFDLLTMPDFWQHTPDRTLALIVRRST